MADPGTNGITDLIAASRQGDRAAADRLFSLIYDELRQVARRVRYVGREGETMQPTALVNEAYLSLMKRFPVPPPGEPENRETFFRALAMAMRSILRDHWRSRQAACHGGGVKPVELTDDVSPAGTGPLDRADYLALDAALDRLEPYNRRWFDVVLHRYFAGRSIEETAQLLRVGVTTVKADWQYARAWLLRELS